LVASTQPAALRILDVNLRQHYYSRALIEESLTAANVLKVNDTELPRLAEMFRLTGDERAQLARVLAAGPGLDTGGDVDADWQRAESSGEEAVGGSVATPDQSVVDELARPLGVERPANAPVITSEEILSSRDRRRWRIEQHTEEQAREADEA